MIRGKPGRGPGEGMDRVGHAIVHTVAALPLDLRAYASSGLREGPPNPYPRHPSSLAYVLDDSLANIPIESLH